MLECRDIDRHSEEEEAVAEAKGGGNESERFRTEEIGD